MVLEGYIKSFGLEAEDVPKVVGTFVFCKYATWGTGILLGVRYQPLRRLLLARSAISKAQPWAQRQRLRLLDVWERARRAPPAPRLAVASGHSAPLPRLPWAAADVSCTARSRAILEAGTETVRLSTRRASSSHRRRFGAGAGDVRRRISFHCRQAMYSATAAHGRLLRLAQRQRLRLQATYIAASARWRGRAFQKWLRFQKLVQRQRHLRQKQLAQLRASRSPSKWYAWVSAKYWKYTDKLEALALKSSTGRFISTNFGLKPQGWAMGIAEGTILFKFTSPLVLPLQLWLVVSFFKRQRLQSFLTTSCEDGSSCRESDEEKQLALV